MTDNTIKLTEALNSKQSLKRETEIFSQEFNIDVELGKRNTEKELQLRSTQNVDSGDSKDYPFEQD